MKITYVLTECGHTNATFEPELFIWDKRFYCEDCKDRKVVMGTKHIFIKEDDDNNNNNNNNNENESLNRYL